MDEPRGHYAKGNSQTEKGILNDIIYMWNQKEILSKTHRNREQNGGCQGFHGWGN